MPELSERTVLVRLSVRQASSLMNMLEGIDQFHNDPSYDPEFGIADYMDFPDALEVNGILDAVGDALWKAGAEGMPHPAPLITEDEIAAVWGEDWRKYWQTKETPLLDAILKIAMGSDGPMITTRTKLEELRRTTLERMRGGDPDEVDSA